MTWNHRIVCDEDGWLEVCEVFYEKGRIYGWHEAGTPCGFEIKEVKSDLKLYAQAFKKPILDVKIVRGKKKLVERPKGS